METTVVKESLFTFGDENSRRVVYKTLSGYIDKSGFGKVSSQDKMEAYLAICRLLTHHSLMVDRVGLKSWFTQNLDTLYDFPSCLALLDDTIEFVNTGYRRMPLAVRINLIKHETTLARGTPNRELLSRKSRLRNDRSSTTLYPTVRAKVHVMDAEFIYRWAMREGGLRDMISFFYHVLPLELE